MNVEKGCLARGLSGYWGRLVVIMVLLSMSAGVFADEIYWDSPIGGSFNEDSLWSPSQAPGADDTALFDLGQDPAYTVSFSGGVTNLSCIFRTDKVDMELGGFSYTLSDEYMGLIIGEYTGHLAEVSMTGGTLHADNARVALWDSDSTGIWTVGTGMTVTLDDELVVGNGGDGAMYVNSGAGVSVGANKLHVGVSGHGYLSVAGGATVRTVGDNGWIEMGMFSESLGEALVSGNGSLLDAERAPIVLGDEGTGYLAVENEGHAHSSGELFLGRSEGGYGEVYVTGNGSRYISDSVYASVVGEGGGGRLAIEDEGYAQVQSLHIGEFETGYGAVELTDTGSSLVVYDSLDIGMSGEGYLTAAGGSSVSVGRMQAGTDPSGYAEMYITGSGSELLVTNDAVIGEGGWAEMYITDGGSAMVNQRVILGQEGDSYGSIFIGPGFVYPMSGFEVEPSFLAPMETSLTSGGGVLGQEEGSCGNVDLYGLSSIETSMWTVGLDYVTHDLIIGQRGEGYLSIGEYSQVVAKDKLVDPCDPGNHASSWVTLGDEATGYGCVTVSGVEAKLVIERSPLTVGREGTGELYVENGGLLQMGHGELLVGLNEGSNGNVYVRHTDSRVEEYSDYDSVVGGAGWGNLYITDGGSVSLSHLMIGSDIGGMGNVVVADASLQIGCYLTVGKDGEGFLDVKSGEWGNPGYMTVGAADLFDVSPGEIRVGSGGIVRGTGTIFGDVVNVGGIVEPGASVETLTIAGNYVQGPDGVLYLEIAGDGAGEYDVLRVEGDVSLEGCLGLWIQEGFLPQQGMTFDLIQFSGISYPESDWFNMAHWVFGLEGYLPLEWEYELNVVQLGDYEWSLRLTSLNSVPEPASLILLALGGLAVRTRRRRERKTD